MSLLRVIPKIFYSDIRDGLALFVDTLGFAVSYHEPSPPFYVIKRDNATLILIEEDEMAKKDRPEIRIATDDIEGLYAEVKERGARFLHPNLPVIRTQPWGLREFALLDETTVCVVIQQDVSR